MGNEVVSSMAIRTHSFSEVTDPGMYSIDEAEHIARQLMEEGQRVPERCALALQAEPPPDDGRAQRMLDLMARITPPARLLPLLDRILPSSNARIRSKAWKLYAAASGDLKWVRQQLDDPDPRVAANVVEALWRARPCPELHAIYHQAANQERNRVAGNGLVGLFLCNDPASQEMTLQLAYHPDPDFRATAAWVIGRVQWREGRQLLLRLRDDSDDKVRLNAERALQKLSRRYPGAA
jgi:HEAT repeat protein